MPFRSLSQIRACYAKNDPNWDCHEFARETKNIKKLPEKVSEKTAEHFAKIAKRMFLSEVFPPVPKIQIQKAAIEESKIAKRGGRGPVEYRNELTRQRSGIVQKSSSAKKR